ncbi:MAG: hypothetical protein U0269_11685 [Polyangiales bacterium]
MSATRVGLIVTGDAEALGFADALQRLWPQSTATFEALENHERPESRKYEAFTTSKISVESVRRQRETLAESHDDPRAPAHIDRLVQACFYHLDPPSRRDAVDYVVVIDDVELANRGNETALLEVVRDAVDRVSSWGSWDQVQRMRVRERSSFHFLDPMLEAYFFASAPSLAAIRREIVSMGTVQTTSASCERFAVDPKDAAFFAPPGECARKRRDRDRKCPWRATGGQNLAEHPKRYLQYLCRAAAPNEFCTDYQETKQGVAALRALDWPSVLAASAPFLQALVEDIADMIGTPPNVSLPPTSSTALTALANTMRARSVLRNV